MFVACAIAFLLNRASLGGAQEYRVVVHQQVKGNQIARDALATIFMGQAKSWGDGTVVLPVDQSLKTDVRGAFTRKLLGKSLLEVQVYWQKKIRDGHTPPPVKGSDEEVLAFVAANRGAVGYVSASATLPAGVKTVEVTY
jgi:ABC-type phosphate transport system substrate-binding protein